MLPVASILLVWLSLILIAISTVLGIRPFRFDLGWLGKFQIALIPEPAMASWPAALSNRPPPVSPF
jgi:hypothetical protein